MATSPLHITSGDIVGGKLAAAGLPGEILVWHDLLYDGPRRPGWPDDALIEARAAFIETMTGGGLTRQQVLKALHGQYRKLASIPPGQPVVLWFDACLFDQSMLVHLLTCLHHTEARPVELICIDAFPGIEPYHGIGQLGTAQLAGCYGLRRSVTAEQFRYAAAADDAFATRDATRLSDLARGADAPLPWVPAAAARWLQAQPDPVTGLGRLEQLALDAIREGHTTPTAIFKAVSAAEEPPQYWGDTTLWAAVNQLAAREPPLVRIEGPANRLPQWESTLPLDAFRITPLSVPPART